MSFFLDHYCATFCCKMSRDACIRRQALAIRQTSYRLNSEVKLVNGGFYPECYNCPTGRSVARSRGANIEKMRKQRRCLRTKIGYSNFVGEFSLQPCAAGHPVIPSHGRFHCLSKASFTKSRVKLTRVS
jgi:hypothetical protein